MDDKEKKTIKKEGKKGIERAMTMLELQTEREKNCRTDCESFFIFYLSSDRVTRLRDLNYDRAFIFLLFSRKLTRHRSPAD